MAEFWEQQLMDRLLNLAFEYRVSEKEIMPAKQVNEVMDFVKFLLKEQEQITIEKIKSSKISI